MIVNIIVEQGKTRIEHFVDEDTNRVVLIDRFKVERTYISQINIPDFAPIRDKALYKERIKRFIDSYLTLCNPNIKLKQIITDNKFKAILNEKIKNKLHIKYIILKDLNVKHLF